MASRLLICSASPLVVPNKANSGPLAAGFGPPSFVTLPSSSRAHSLVAKAQDQPGSDSLVAKAQDQPGSEFGYANLPPLSGGESWHNRIALIESPRYVRSPLRLTERPDEVEISYDMAGHLPQNTKAEITAGNTLHLRGPKNERILSYQLPPYCDGEYVKSDAKGKLELGVLTIKIPKSTVNNESPPTNIPINSPESTVNDSAPTKIPINPQSNR